MPAHLRRRRIEAVDDNDVGVEFACADFDCRPDMDVASDGQTISMVGLGNQTGVGFHPVTDRIFEGGFE